ILLIHPTRFLQMSNANPLDRKHSPNLGYETISNTMSSLIVLNLWMFLSHYCNMERQKGSIS
ncbi:MAG TPA: hypothetical protein VFY68_09765, partial [Nitrososphaeraceae archaeon]|nr:hypothetical protein [Nitrososphaeraceae archaeon]